MATTRTVASSQEVMGISSPGEPSDSLLEANRISNEPVASASTLSQTRVGFKWRQLYALLVVAVGITGITVWLAFRRTGLYWQRGFSVSFLGGVNEPQIRDPALTKQRDGEIEATGVAAKFGLPKPYTSRQFGTFKSDTEYAWSSEEKEAVVEELPPFDESSRHIHIPVDSSTSAYIDRVLNVGYNHSLVYDSMHDMWNISAMRFVKDTIADKDDPNVASYVEEWTAKVRAFRRFMRQSGLWTSRLPPVFDLDEPFGDPKIDSPRPAAINLTEKVKSSPLRIVNMSVVAPVWLRRVNLSWPFMEGFWQQTVWPKEIIFVACASNDVRPSYYMGFVRVMREVYGSFLPPGVSLKIYGKYERLWAWGNRYAGFLKSTGDPVAILDVDDYFNPRTVEFLWGEFVHHPEMDHLLIGYNYIKAKTWSRVAHFTKIVRFLEKNWFSDEHIQKLYTRDNSIWYDYERGKTPTFNKTWRLGNRKTEPNWKKGQSWYHRNCANGWTITRRAVFSHILPPTIKSFGEDSLWNWMLLRSGFNVLCVSQPNLGGYMKTYGKVRPLWHTHSNIVNWTAVTEPE